MGLFLLAGISYQTLYLMADTGQQEPAMLFEKESGLWTQNTADRYIRVKVSHTADPPRPLFAERAITVQPESRLAICRP